jgi:hypothetical protein
MVTLYTNWGHGTLASGQYSHASPEVPATFTWGAVHGAQVVDNDPPWNGQTLLDIGTVWYGRAEAVVSSATAQATSGRLLLEVDSSTTANSPILHLGAANNSHGLLRIEHRSDGTIYTDFQWGGWAGYNIVNLGAVPTVPFAVEIIYDSNNATANQRLRARMWNIVDTPGSFSDSSQADGNAGTTDQFTTVLLGSGNDWTRHILGRLIISNSTTEDLSLVSEALSMPPRHRHIQHLIGR